MSIEGLWKYGESIEMYEEGLRKVWMIKGMGRGRSMESKYVWEKVKR